MAELLVLATGLFGVVLATTRWRWGLVAAFVMVVLEGALRKWVAPGQGTLLYFAKDALLLATCYGCHRERWWRWRPGVRATALPLLVTLNSAWIILQTVNPGVPSLALGLFGLRVHLLGLVFLFIIPTFATSPPQLLQAVRSYLVPITASVVVLALVQFASSAESWINVYAQGADGGDITVAGYGEGRVRVTGTFSYISGFATYVQMAAACLTCLLLNPGQRGWLSRAVPLVLALTVGAIPANGSRSLVVTLAVSTLLALFALRDRRLLTPRQIATAGITLVLIYLAVTLFSEESVEALVDRARGSGDTASRFTKMYEVPLHYLTIVGPIGCGVGTAHQAAPIIVGHDNTWLPPELRAYEEESGRILIELGPIGFILTFALRIYLVALAYRCVRRARTRSEISLALMSLLVMAPYLVGNLVYNSVASYYYWFAAGVTVWLVERQTRVLPAPHSSDQRV